MLFLLGPTGVGKSSLAMELARASDAAILSLDSMQIYRGADIGTSKPTMEEREEVLHGGLDLAEVGEEFSVARYLEEAGRFLEKCRADHRRVIGVGGTGLYFRALTSGMCPAPETPVALREELDLLSVGELQERLRRVDEAILPQLDVKNPRRLARAIAVKESTGRSLREWQQENGPALVPEFTAHLLEVEPQKLRAKQVTRLGQMLGDGWIEEVDTLVRRHGRCAVQKFPAIGYSELATALPHLAMEVCGHSADGPCPTPGELASHDAATLAHIKEEIAQQTWQYSRRQLTWFRRETKVTPLSVESLPSAMKSLERHLL